MTIFDIPKIIKSKGIKSKDTLDLITPCDVLIFCSDLNRGVTLNNQAYSSLIDSVKDDIQAKGFTSISVAYPGSVLTGRKGYGNPISINRSYLSAKILTTLFYRFGLRLDIKLYERIINKSNPKLIVSISCNSLLCEAARNLEVFHAELLHGIGYNAIPWDWDKKEKKHLPQCILSLDEVSTQSFSELQRHNIIIKNIPHPFLRRFQGEYIKKIPNEWLPSKRKNQYNKEILISLQWGYTPGIDELELFTGVLANGLFYDEIEEVIKRTHGTIFWRFRFHPVQYRQPEKYKKLFRFIEIFVGKYENCDWEESTYMPLPSLLSRSSGHITMSSMASYEAAYLGVPTLALGPSLIEGKAHENLFDDLVTQNYLIKQSPQADNILEWVNSVEKKEPLLDSLSEKESQVNTVDWLFEQAEKSTIK